LFPLRQAAPGPQTTHCPPAARPRRSLHADVPYVIGLALIADQVPSLSPQSSALSYDRVPPTVRSWMPSVGKPTPTGTDCPFFPHVPTPVSSARSFPTMVIRVRTSGPLPMRLAPLTGRVSLPCSMR